MTEKPPIASQMFNLRAALAINDMDISSYRAKLALVPELEERLAACVEKRTKLLMEIEELEATP